MLSSMASKMRGVHLASRTSLEPLNLSSYLVVQRTNEDVWPVLMASWYRSRISSNSRPYCALNSPRQVRLCNCRRPSRPLCIFSLPNDFSTKRSIPCSSRRAIGVACACYCMSVIDQTVDVEKHSPQQASSTPDRARPDTRVYVPPSLCYSELLLPRLTSVG
jgi:hypothetical protein